MIAKSFPMLAARWVAFMYGIWVANQARRSGQQIEEHEDDVQEAQHPEHYAKRAAFIQQCGEKNSHQTQDAAHSRPGEGHLELQAGISRYLLHGRDPSKEVEGDAPYSDSILEGDIAVPQLVKGHTGEEDQ